MSYWRLPPGFINSEMSAHLVAAVNKAWSDDEGLRDEGINELTHAVYEALQGNVEVARELVPLIGEELSERHKIPWPLAIYVGCALGNAACTPKSSYVIEPKRFVEELKLPMRSGGRRTASPALIRLRDAVLKNEIYRSALMEAQKKPRKRSVEAREVQAIYTNTEDAPSGKIALPSIESIGESEFLDENSVERMLREARKAMGRKQNRRKNPG